MATTGVVPLPQCVVERTLVFRLVVGALKFRQPLVNVLHRIADREKRLDELSVGVAETCAGWRRKGATQMKEHGTAPKERLDVRARERGYAIGMAVQEGLLATRPAKEGPRLPYSGVPDVEHGAIRGSSHVVSLTTGPDDCGVCVEKMQAIDDFARL